MSTKTKTSLSTKTKILLPFVLVFLGYCATSRANITDAWWNDDGDGAIVCSSWAFNNPDLTMTGNEYMAGAAHMLGWVNTDSALDPTLYLGSGVDNDTSFAWTGYLVNVVMAVPFTFSGTPSVSSPLSDWSVASVAAPTLQVGGLYIGKYEGTIDLTSGTPIGIGDELDFSYAIHFSSSTDYAFTQEMIPQGVPEPGDLGLVTGLLFGGFELVKRLRKKT